MGVTGILLANLITALAFAVYTGIVFFPKIRLAFNKSQSVETLKYSLPLIPHTLSFWAINMMDRVLMNNLSNAAATGIYSVGNQVGSTMNVVSSSVNQAYSPWFYDVIRNPEKNTAVVISMTRKLASLYCLIALTLSLFSQEAIALLTNAKYHDSWMVIPVVAFGCVFLGYYHFFANVILLEKKTKALAVISVCTGIISIAMNVLLIPAFGGMGAAFAGTISYTITSFAAFFVARNMRPDIRFRALEMYSLLFFMAGISGVSYLGSFMPVVFFLAVKILLLLAVVGFLTYKNKKELKQLWLKTRLKWQKENQVVLSSN